MASIRIVAESGRRNINGNMAKRAYDVSRAGQPSWRIVLSA